MEFTLPLLLTLAASAVAKGTVCPTNMPCHKIGTEPRPPSVLDATIKANGKS